MKLKKRYKIIISILTVLILTAAYCYVEPYWLKIEEVTVSSADLPVSFDGIRIAFISDIHHGPYFSIERVKSMVDEINELKPDIIVLGGDYVHRDKKYIRPVFAELGRLRATFGVYAVLGNHDYWESAELTHEMMAIYGINDCENNSFWVKEGKDSFKIGGVGDLWVGVQEPHKTLAWLKNSDFCILISHNPDYLENFNSELVDLTLSGHTHGGQITLFGLWAPVIPSKYGQKYRYGLKKFLNTQSYISSGVGTITPPVRFFCRPEIAVLTLRRAK